MYNWQCFPIIRRSHIHPMNQPFVGCCLSSKSEVCCMPNNTVHQCSSEDGFIVGYPIMIYFQPIDDTLALPIIIHSLSHIILLWLKQSHEPPLVNILDGKHTNHQVSQFWGWLMALFWPEFCWVYQLTSFCHLFFLVPSSAWPP